MKILIVTDAWLPQINGVVRTLQATQKELEKSGHDVLVIGPDVRRWCAFHLPTYDEIVLELFPFGRLKRAIDSFQPDTLHIATEGPLGRAARFMCLLKGWSFTTAYHTRFPQYLAARVPGFLRSFVQEAAFAILRRFHNAGQATLVPTPSIARELVDKGFTHVQEWSRGVDTELFRPCGKTFPPYAALSRPILLYVGRVAVEKNIEAFLRLQTSGSKVVVGSGPDRAKLEKKYQDVHFIGRKEGEELAAAYSAADLFVFPSKSDTFGLVLLEACAAGLRVAAYPVMGPKDIFEGQAGSETFVALDMDLQKAVDRALTLSESPDGPRGFAEKHAWGVSTGQFFSHLCPLKPFSG